MHDNPENEGPCLGLYMGSSDEEEVKVKPNLEFIQKFEENQSFPNAANFIRGWFNNKKFPSNAADFANDFPEIIDRACRVRHLLISFRKERGLPLEIILN